MGRIAVSRQSPPVLGNGVYFKDIPYRSEIDFADALATWIAGFVSRERAMHLVVNASGYADILRHIQHSGPTMQLRSGGAVPTWRVHVDFIWGRLPNGQWWVSGIGLHINDTVNRIAATDTVALRERLLDEAELRHARAMPPRRKLWFEVEKYSSDFDGDLRQGRQGVENLINQVYKVAKEVAKLPTNPIGPDPDDPQAILIAVLSGGVGAATGGAITALEELGMTARKGFEVAHKAAELGDKVYGRAMDNDANKAFVDLIEIGLSLSKVAGPFAPLASAIIGSFIEIGIANMAGPVSRVRSHMYVCFVGGVISELVKETSIRPARPGDEVLFNFGAKAAAKIGPEQRYNLQLALMEYALRHPMGQWNLNAMYPGATLPPFPDAYLRYWSSGMLERSLLVQLCKAKYLYQ